MIQSNVDYSTGRRLTGWAFDDTTRLPVAGLVLSAGTRSHAVAGVARDDVASTFQLESNLVGFDLIVPDCFDGVVGDYALLAGGQQIFSFRSGIQDIALATAEALEQDTIAVAGSAKVFPDYARGRHVLFIHGGSDALSARMRLLLQEKRFRSFFPANVSGCTISHLAVAELDAHKKSIVPRLDEFLLVCPSDLAAALHRVSPSLFGAKRFVTLYEGGSLQSRFGIHELQLNNFIAAKAAARYFEDPWLASITAVWSAVENYATPIFSARSNTYFMAHDDTYHDPRLIEFARTHVQGHRSEDMVRLKRGAESMTLVNFAAYAQIFDKLGAVDCWRTAVRRGLSHTQLEI